MPTFEEYTNTGTLRSLFSWIQRRFILSPDYSKACYDPGLYHLFPMQVNSFIFYSYENAFISQMHAAHDAGDDNITTQSDSLSSSDE